MLNFQEKIEILYSKYAETCEWDKTSVMLELKGMLEWCYPLGARYSEFLTELTELKYKYHGFDQIRKVEVLRELEEMK